MKKQKPKKCKYSKCKKDFMPWSTTQATCDNYLCALGYAAEKKAKKEKKEHAKAKRETREQLKALMTRTKWFAKLQVVVNQWVLYRDRDEPCCTCGTTRPIKFDAGHFHTVKARSDIRFELTQIHRQCSQNCNVYGSGMRNEYEKFLIEKYGPSHIDYLEELRPNLKEQFPNWQDIEERIIYYRKKLRSVGVKPHI
jgi:hypothetical protein